MINLLADDRKQQIAAARVNVLLLRYIGIVVLAIIFLMGILGISYVILQNTNANAEAIIESNDTKADVYSETKNKVDALETKLRESRVILDKEIRYSDVLLQLGQLMPEGAILNSLTLNEQSFKGTPTEIKVYAKTDSIALAVNKQLRSSPLFNQVTLKGTESSGGITGYPIVVTLSVAFNRARV